MNKWDDLVGGFPIIFGLTPMYLYFLGVASPAVNEGFCGSKYPKMYRNNSKLVVTVAGKTSPLHH